MSDKISNCKQSTVTRKMKIHVLTFCSLSPFSLAERIQLIHTGIELCMTSYLQTMRFIHTEVTSCTYQ